MPDPLDRVLGLVAGGRLSAEEAAPIVDALASARRAADQARAAGGSARDAAKSVADAARIGLEGRRPDRGSAGGPPPTPPPASPRRLRIQVRDEGRTVVDLQLPGILAELAGALPGIPAAYAEQAAAALRGGLRGPILDVSDEDGSGVTIAID